MQRDAIGGGECAEGVRAFFEGRKPDFRKGGHTW